MEVLEQGKLKITGAECLGAVEEAQLQQALGRHGVLRATVWLLPDRDSAGENEKWKGLPISLTAEGREEEPIFCGLVKHACFRKNKGRPAVQLTAYSYTVQLDAEKRDRSYQQESRTWGELVEMLLAPCGGVYIWSRPGKDMPVGRFLMQYKETDWQFLCRAASRQGYAVVPEVRLPGARLYIGLPEGRKEQPLEADTWRVRKTLAKPSQTVDNGDSGTLSGGTEILVEDCYEDYLLGDAVAFQGSSLFIAGKDSRLSGNQWVHTYTLRTEEECHKGKIDNPYMAGAAVKGTVLETTLTSSRLILETDAEGEQPESLHQQPVYYAGDGKGYSGQPEKWDTQYLYFPTMREEERYIIGCADAGTKQIDALLESIESESSEEESSEAAAGGETVGSAVAEAGTVPLSAPLPSLSGAGVSSGQEDTGADTKTWSTPGKRRLVLGEGGIQLSNAGKGRISVISSRIRVFGTGDLELESRQIAGIGKKLTIEAPNYIWLHSGESGILLAPDGVQVKSAELELKSPASLLRKPSRDDYVQTVLEKYDQRRKNALPYAASDGSMIRREGYNDILYSEEMFEYFENHVYGTEGYENKAEQPIDLIYQCWLDDVYGRTEAGKFWDHMETLDGLQDALDVIGIFFDGADLINMAISACRGEWKEAGTYLVCALPLIGDLLGKGWKWMASTGIDSALKITNKGDDILDTLKVSYRAASDKAAELRKYLDDAVGEMFAGGSSCRLAVADGIYLDNSSRMMVEIYDETGELTQFARRLDEAGELTQMSREAENVSELAQMDREADNVSELAQMDREVDNVSELTQVTREAGEVPYNHGGTGGSGSALEGSTVPDFYVGSNGKALPGQYKDWIGTNMQKELLNQTKNPQLQNAIKQLYRGNSFIGDGGTADVIRFEQQTGLMLGKNGGSHVQKGIDMAKYIENKILTQDLCPSDRALATQLLEDLYSALGR